MTNPKFWKPIYQLFKPEEPLEKPEDIRDFYVSRSDSPVEHLVNALEMFASPLLTELNCHIIYTIPISLRYSPSFRQPMQRFQDCLDLANIPVFECDTNLCPTTQPDQMGRQILKQVIEKRLARLTHYNTQDLFTPEAVELKTHTLPNKGEFVISDELLQNKFVLGYYDKNQNPWFDVNPILIEDLQRWQATQG